MTRLAHIFLASTIVSVLAAIALGWALINEAAQSSAYSQESYKNGLRDGEQFARDRIRRAEAMAEIIEESKAHIAEERL